MPEPWRPSAPLPSPNIGTGYVGWLKNNLLSSPGNILLTLLSISLLILTVPPLLRWGLLDATWLGDSRAVCDQAAADGTTGACWVFIKVRLGVFLYGFYPPIERWRVNFTLIVLAAALLPLFAPTLLRTNSRKVLLYLVATAARLLLYGSIPAAFIACYLLAPFVLDRLLLGKPFLELFTNRLLAVLTGIGCALLIGLSVYYLVLFSLGGEAAGAIGITALLLTVFLLFVSRLTATGWHWVLLFTVYPVFAFFMLVGDTLVFHWSKPISGAVSF